MYFISEEEWKDLKKRHPDYAGRSVRDPNVRVIFEGAIPGNNGKGGTALLFEGRHFIVTDGQPSEGRQAASIAACPCL